MTGDPCPLAGWEIASWTLACLVALVLVAALVQHALDASAWSHVETRRPAHVCLRGCPPLPR